MKSLKRIITPICTLSFSFIVLFVCFLFHSHHLWLPHAEAHRPITSSSATKATAKPATTTTLTRNECFEHVFSFMVFFFGENYWLWASFDLHVALITILDVAEKSSFKWRRTHKEYTIKWSSSGRPPEIHTECDANEIKYKNIVSLFGCISIDEHITMSVSVSVYVFCCLR